MLSAAALVHTHLAAHTDAEEADEWRRRSGVADHRK
jgi:hypothetical protein